MHTTGSRLFKKTLLLLLPFILIGVCVILVMNYLHDRDMAERGAGERAMAIAASGAALINGDAFEEIERINDYAIYERVREGNGLKHHNGYEVVKITKYKKDVEIKGVQVAKAGDEKYPSNEQWGTKGWTFMTLEGARKKLNELVS